MLTDKVAIITGASRGIGLALAHALSQEGAKVYGIARSTPPRQANDSFVTISADVRKTDEIENAIAMVIEQAGTIDILVNNAGLEYFKPFGETSAEEYDRLLDTNLRGAFLITKAVLPTMLAKRSGHLVFINSVSGTRGFAQDAVYCASKFGLAGLAEALDEELRAQGVRVTSIFPGATDTQLSLDSWAPANDPHRAFFLKPEDVAEAVVFAIKQPAHVAISQIVMRPFIETIYSDFLSPELATLIIPLSPGPSAE
jgi:3-oxoacyl-[acyl-carrier protein] reductase